MAFIITTSTHRHPFMWEVSKMYLLFILFLKLIVTDNLPPPKPQEIPIVSESQKACPCSQSQEQTNLCRGGIYVDYYYNAPYSGYPKDATYPPSVDSVPVIIEKLSSIRDSIKEFVSGANSQESNAKKALYIKNDFSKIKFLLQAVHKAAKKANIRETTTPD